MSKPEIPTPQPLTPEQQHQQMFSRLSAQYKTPLRNILSETEEVVQNTISNLIHQIIQMTNALKNTNNEVLRLQKLCLDNHLSIMPKSPNRKERRAEERKQDKKKKITSTVKK